MSKRGRRIGRALVAAGATALAPALAEAHVVGGSNSWTDELVCLVPVVAFVVAVFVFGRDPKAPDSNAPDPNTTKRNAGPKDPTSEHQGQG